MHLNKSQKQILGVGLGMLFGIIMIWAGFEQIFESSNPNWVNPTIGTAMIVIGGFVVYQIYLYGRKIDSRN